MNLRIYVNFNFDISPWWLDIRADESPTSEEDAEQKNEDDENENPHDFGDQETTPFGSIPPQCPFAAMFEDIKRARAAAQEETQPIDFLESQLERDRLIEQKKLINFTKPDDDLFLIKQLDNIELSKEERDRELAERRAQLEAIFNLLKKQEQELAEAERKSAESEAEATTSTSNTTTTNESGNETGFSVLKEDGTYEKKEVELKKDFESQMRLYGL